MTPTERSEDRIDLLERAWCQCELKELRLAVDCLNAQSNDPYAFGFYMDVDGNFRITRKNQHLAIATDNEHWDVSRLRRELFDGTIAKKIDMPARWGMR